jgi:hypothetical protein
MNCPSEGTPYASHQIASVCRTTRALDSRFEVTGLGTVVPEDMRRLGSNPVATFAARCQDGSSPPQGPNRRIALTP